MEEYEEAIDLSQDLEVEVRKRCANAGSLHDRCKVRNLLSDHTQSMRSRLLPAEGLLQFKAKLNPNLETVLGLEHKDLATAGQVRIARHQEGKRIGNIMHVVVGTKKVVNTARQFAKRSAQGLGPPNIIGLTVPWTERE